MTMTLTQAKEKLLQLAKLLEHQAETAEADAKQRDLHGSLMEHDAKRSRRVGKAKSKQAQAIHLVLEELSSKTSELESERARADGIDPWDY